MRRWIAAALVLSIPVAAGFTGFLQANPDRDIKSKDAEVRLGAVETLRKRGDDKAGKALIKALGDDDWEVADRAAAALSDFSGRSTLTALSKAALAGKVRRLRRTAARSMGEVDAVLAVELLTKKVGSRRDRERACLALAEILPCEGGDAASAAIEGACKSKEASQRAVAARALAGVSAARRVERLKSLLVDESPIVRCAALEAVARAPEPDYLPPILHQLTRPEVSSVVERRLVAAARAIAARALAEGGPEAVDELFRKQLSTQSVPHVSEAARRLAELVAALATLEREGARPLEEMAWAFLRRALAVADPATRTAAAHALRRFSGQDFGPDSLHADELPLDFAVKLAMGDADARVRRAALKSLAGARGVEHDITRWMMRDLLGDPDPEVRRAAAVSLGRPEVRDVRKELQAAVNDPDWRVAACAAVSIGKTRDLSGIPVLRELYRESDDWRLRGAAVVGLTHTYASQAIGTLIEALEDSEPAVARTAHEYLRALTRADLDRRSATWKEWWDANGKGVRFATPEEAREQREKYGYAVSPSQVYANLDVVVLDSRGDHIQGLLARIGIAHRMTQQAHLTEDELHPDAIYVSNCTGEIVDADVERLQWFVLCGGYLFASCWSLGHTIELVEPGVVRMLPDHMEGSVMDDVLAEPCAVASPYLEGVFPDGLRPYYHLEGAHLIDVLRPERCEVLIDSPECADRWGGGDLAVWFEVGHGLILDSVNHFDLQGLESARGLKTPEQRQAFAVDHMGLSFEELRALREEKWWKSSTTAADHVFDESAFRFITNFVRQKRLGDR